MKENWKSIRGYDGLYEVSDLGRIRSLNYNHTGKVKVLRPQNCRGYLCVGLCKDREKKNFLIHTLVITTFRGPIPVGMQVNHKNEDKTDNRLSNLEVVSPKENVNWGTRNERAGKAISKKLVLTLAENPYTKLTFPNSYEASEFFSYKNKTQIGYRISRARKRGENFINIRKTKYYFSQAQ